MFSDSNALRMGAKTLARDQPGAELRQLTLGELRVMIEQPLGEDELEDGIAEKFEPLIVEMVALRFVTQAGVSERLCEEERIPKLVFKPLFERIHAVRREAEGSEL
jgi:hypothetical protein